MMKIDINFMQILDELKALVEKHGEDQAEKAFNCLTKLHDLIHETDEETRQIVATFFVDLIIKNK
jgi:hypothetical protein